VDHVEPPFILGVVADTHVPDRVSDLHPGLISALRAAGVQRSRHCGDACVNRVMEELEQVAPVTTVRGNRDWMLRPLPPLTQRIELAGVRLVAVHGQGGFFSYWLDKVQYVLKGYRFERYRQRFQVEWSDADVFVFGHTHKYENRRMDGCLFFNPGSASFGFSVENSVPSFGLLRLGPGRQVRGEMCPLEGWRVKRGGWMRV
jgi:putative phosphoesterase